MARSVTGNSLMQLHILAPEKLLRWVEDEAAKRSKSKTDIIIEALERLKEERK